MLLCTYNVRELCHGAAAGQALWKEVLTDFWVPFEALISQTSGISITEVIDVLDPLIGAQFFPPQVSLQRWHQLCMPGASVSCLAAIAAMLHAKMGKMPATCFWSYYNIVCDMVATRPHDWDAPASQANCLIGLSRHVLVHHEG